MATKVLKRDLIKGAETLQESLNRVLESRGVRRQVTKEGVLEANVELMHQLSMQLMGVDLPRREKKDITLKIRTRRKRK